jgi:hypothetical protein
MKRLLLLALLLLPLLAHAQRPQVYCAPLTPCNPATGPKFTSTGDQAWAAFGNVNLVLGTYAQTSAEASAGANPVNLGYLPLNGLRYGADPSGVADSAGALQLALNVAAVNCGTVELPAGTYSLSTALNVGSCVRIHGQAGSKLIARAGNVSNPVLLAVSVKSNILIQGVTFDGGGTSFANTNTVVTVFQSSGVIFDGVTGQNTRGDMILFSEADSSGVQNSYFLNIGMFWQTSLLTSDRHSAVTFCCTAGGIQGFNNFALNNYFTNIGLDPISTGVQTNFAAVGNRCYLHLATPQYVTLSSATDWPGCIFSSGDTSITITGNIADSAPGNGIDIASSTGALVVTGNYITTAGGNGINISNTSNIAASGNVVLNSGAHTAACGRAGIYLADAISLGTIGHNTLTDTRGGGSKTQQYGIFAETACSHAATLTNVLIDETNQTAGNAAGAYGGGLSNPTTWALSPTQAGNWVFQASSGIPLLAYANASLPGIIVSANATGQAVTVDAAAANSAFLGVTTANVTRWFVGKSNGAESGSNAGADFCWYAYADGGGFLGNTLCITRATGQVSILAPYSGTGPSLAIGGITKLGATTVATIGTTCSSGQTGSTVYVTDATAPTLGSTVAGSGAAKALVWCNGANWTVTGK